MAGNKILFMKILHVISSLDPACGGPIEGLKQLAVSMLQLGHNVEVLTLDECQAVFLEKLPFEVHALGPHVTGYWYSALLVPWLRKHAAEYDAVIVHGLWQYIGLAVRHALAGSGTPYYVFAHGMLGPWFKHTYPLKHLKKWLYWPWAEYRVLRDARRVLFTCEVELLLARKSFWLYKATEAVSGFGVMNPPESGDELADNFLAQFPHLQGRRIALYLSRIHQVKGCDLLIEAFARVAQRDEKLHLVMAGPDQTDWVSNLRARAETLGVAHRITWTGILQGDMKWGAYYAAEVFCLPSHHENFGVVVVEALACGIPVLISNKVNIWREIAASGAGLVADDTLDGTDELLRRWLSMSADEFAAMQVKTKPCFENHFHVQRAAVRLLEIIRESN